MTQIENIPERASEVPAQVTREEAIQAFYAELLGSKPEGGEVTPADLDQVSDQAQEFMTGQTATGAIETDWRYLLGGPISKLWMDGILSSTVYFKWAHAKEMIVVRHEQAKTPPSRSWLK